MTEQKSNIQPSRELLKRNLGTQEELNLILRNLFCLDLNNHIFIRQL